MDLQKERVTVAKKLAETLKKDWIEASEFLAESNIFHSYVIYYCKF